jgi:hypothetical protein
MTNAPKNSPDDQPPEPAPRLRTRFRRVWRRARPLIYTVAFAYVMLLCFPQILFAHSRTHRGFEVYSDAPIGREIEPIVDRAVARLETCPWWDPAIRHRVFLCKSEWRRRLLMPLSPKGLASTYPLTGHTIVGPTDLASDRMVRPNANGVKRTLSGVLAHERTHDLINRRFGLPRARLLPHWKVEGYCDYVGGEPAYDPVTGDRAILRGETPGALAFRYYLACRLVRHLLDDRGLSPDELMRRPLDEDQVRSAVRDRLAGR